MKETKKSIAIKIFQDNNQIMRMSDALNQGVEKHILYEMATEGSLIREDRGLYRLASSDQLSNPDFIQVSLMIPKGVICLISALYVYNLTTEIPGKVFIAIPRTVRTPRINYPPVEVVRLSEEPYITGIEKITMDGFEVSIYNVEKTICDCFKFRNRVGFNVAIEALKDYMTRQQPDISKIVSYSRVNRVEKLMKPYLEALL
jgi:predicted transcriptional regulator of viral defense system